MKVAVYIRISTEEQATEGYFISAQKTRLKSILYCPGMGYILLLCR